MHNWVPKAPTARTNVDIGNCACRWALWPPRGRNEDFGTSPFFGQLFRQACLPVYAMWPTWSTTTALDRLGAPVFDNFSSYPHMATFGSSISRVVGRYRHDD